MSVYILIMVRKPAGHQSQHLIEGVFRFENDAKNAMKTSFQMQRNFFEKYDQLKAVEICSSQCEFTTRDVTYQYYIDTQHLK